MPHIVVLLMCHMVVLLQHFCAPNKLHVMIINRQVITNRWQLDRLLVLFIIRILIGFLASVLITK